MSPTRGGGKSRNVVWEKSQCTWYSTILHPSTKFEIATTHYNDDGKQASGTGAYLLFVQYVVVNDSVPTTFLLLAINVVIVYH